MKRLFIACMFLLAVQLLQGQRIKALVIGDKMPDVQLTILDKGIIKQVSLASLYGKQPVILDFWATWCGPCIKTITEADSLLRITKANVLFLPISYETAATVQGHIRKHKRLQDVPFLFAVHDSILAGKLIEMKGIPHEVWVGTDGIIKAITYPEEVDAEHLVLFAKGVLPALPVKLDLVDIDYSKPIPFDNSEILARSILTRYKPGISALMGVYSNAFDLTATSNRFAGLNHSALSLYYAAYSCNEGILRFNRVELNVKDTLGLHPYLYESKKGRKLVKQHLYCYELILPKATRINFLYDEVMQELNRLLPYSAGIEKRNRPCWILRKTDTSKSIVRSEGKPEATWNKGVLSKLKRYPLSVLTNFLNWQMEEPVVNESDVEGPVDLEFDLDYAVKEGVLSISFSSINKSLAAYGLELVKGVRAVEILVIKDKQTNLPL